MTATRDDATLLVQLLRWGTGLGFDDALRVIFDEGFDPETAPMDEPAVGKVLTFGETLGTLVKHGLLDKELVIDLLWMEGMWGRVAPHARRAREQAGEPRLYENFEALVQ